MGRLKILICISPQYFIDLVIKVYRDVNIDVMDKFLMIYLIHVLQHDGTNHGMNTTYPKRLET